MLGGDYEYIATDAKVSAETKILQEEVTLRASFNVVRVALAHRIEPDCQPLPADAPDDARV